MKKLLALVMAIAMLTICTAAMADTMGLGITYAISSYHSKNAAADADGVLEVDATSCAVVIDDAGKIVDVQFDVAQAKGTFNAAGEITCTMDAPIKTKVELADEYNMRPASPIGKEIHEQIAALEDWCVGKTLEEVVAGSADDADLKAGCTITISDYIAALTKAVANAQ